MDKITVIHTDGNKEDFKPRLISQTIITETGTDKELAERIQDRIAKKLYKLKQNDGLTEISTSDIRAEVSSQLLKEGHFKAVEQNRKLGMSVSEFEDLLQNGCKDNANIGYTPEMIAKYAYDGVAKEYALMDMPKHCSEAHKEGLLHWHDMEYFHLRPNCMNYDLRFFAKNGLKIDGHGLMGSVAKPAKSLEVLLNHLLQAFMAGATVFSGGQGYANFNSLLSVFARGRTYEEIKQAIQGFIFNCNMSLICRGGQCLFSSIGIDMSMPEILKNEPAIGPGGIVSGVYGDYQKEADLIFRAVLEVSNEKDGIGAYHRFPNILINIREGDLDEYSGNCKLVHEIGANNPTLYYVNCAESERTVMGCFSPDTSLWVKIDNQLRYLSFKEIDELLNADIGKTKVNNIEVLTVDDDKNIIWHKAKNFIKNKEQELYKIILSDGKSFICDKNHQMISFESLDKVSFFNSQNDDFLGVDVNLRLPYKVRIKEIVPLNEKDYTYCFEVNDRIIVGDDFILTGNCRTALPMNWTGSYDVDCLNTGNFAYTTLNLPLIALDSNGDVNKFYQKLDEVCEIAYDGLIYRRNCVIDTIYNKHMSDFLLQEDKDSGKPLYDIDNTTITLGFCGLYECLESLNNISDNEGEKILKFLNSKKEEFHERDNLRWSVIGSPAESTAHRFALIIKDKYPDAIVQGVKGNYYLTNSNHIPVSDDSNIVAHIKNAQQYNKLTLGGSILHLWLGEVWSDAEAIWSLNKKIIDSDVTFWAYSKVFTYCRECQFTINDNISVCPICGSTDLVTYDRCTGYYLPTLGFNNGKQQEFKDRYRHKL